MTDNIYRSKNSMQDLKYVLITAARNEDACIEKTLKSVISQTILPERWVIVSDDSTDRTDEIVSDYAQRYDFLHFVRKHKREGQGFECKVYALSEGLLHIGDVDYSFIGIVDGDVSFDRDYYKNILSQFERNPEMGLAGGFIFDEFKGKLYPFFTNPMNVGGPIQLFRRQCFDDIRGFIPLEYGGEDSVAITMARMKGWDVQSFPENRVLHHKPSQFCLRRLFFNGIMEYSVGTYFLYQLLRSSGRIFRKPFFLGGFLLLLGYLWAFCTRKAIVVPMDVVKYMHREQLCRMWSVFMRSKVQFS